MKKLLFLLAALLICGAGFSQRTVTSNSINSGASDTVSYETGTPRDNFFGETWSYHLDYRDFDDTDATLGLYFSNHHPDSSVYVLLFFDENLDGTNDNPYTLSGATDATQTLFKWGSEFPGLYFVRVLTRGSVSDSTTAVEKIIRK